MRLSILNRIAFLVRVLKSPLIIIVNIYSLDMKSNKIITEIRRSIQNVYSIDKNIIKICFIWLFLSGLFAIYYYQTVLSPHLVSLPNWFENILHGNAASPYNYRLLAPSLFKAVDLASPINSDYNIFIATFICFLFSFALLMRAIAFQLTDRSSINSLLFTSFFILLTFPMGGVQPWSYIDIGLYALAYIAVNNAWKTRYYLIILSFALLNRETGYLLSMIPFMIAMLNKKVFLNFSLYKKEILILVYGIIFLLFIRLFQGAATHVITTEEVFSRNFSPEAFVVNVFVYGGAFFWLLIGERVKLSNVEKAFIGILIINVILILFFGLFREIRMFVPYTFLFGLVYSRRSKKSAV